MPTVGPAKTRRTNRRLARVRLANPKALPNVKADNSYTPREVRRVKKVDRRIRARAEARKRAKQYNPLLPLTGARERQELRAAEKLEFGPAESELRRAMGAQQQTAVNRASYYDEYKQALREATARVNEANRQNVEMATQRADTAYEQDKAGLAQRDAEAAEQAAKFGRPAPGSPEGAQALESRRSSANDALARLRDRAAADTRFTEMREATASLKKAEDATRSDSKAARLRAEAKELAEKKGAFRTDLRRKTREDERQYALLRKEFGLKKKDLKLKYRDTAEDRVLERQKLRSARIVARIYASADRAGARAQVRVAKINLEKGRITKDQYREIVNIYKGLPKPGKSGSAGKPAPKPLTVTEEKTVKRAFKRLADADPPPRVDQRKEVIDRLIGKYGYPPRVAREAWERYARQAPGSNYNKGNQPG